MNSSYEQKLSTAALMQRNQFTPPASAETAGESGSGTQNNSSPQMIYLRSAEESRWIRERMEILEHTLVRAMEEQKEMEQELVGQISELATQKQMDCLKEQMTDLQRTLKEIQQQLQAGNRKEKSFSLPRIRLPYLLPTDRNETIFLGVAMGSCGLFLRLGLLHHFATIFQLLKALLVLLVPV